MNSRLVFTIAFDSAPPEALISVEVDLRDGEATLDDLLALMKAGIQVKLGRANLTLRDLILMWQSGTVPV